MPYVPRYWNRRSQQAPTRSDYLDDPSPDTLLQDPRFQREYREMRKRQADGANSEQWTEDELLRDFYQHQTWVNNNSVAASIEFGRSAFATDAQKERMARIQRAYELAPTRSITDGDAWADWAGATLIDPLVLFSVGKAGQGAWVASKAGKGALGVARAGAISGARAGAIEGAGSELAIDALTQARATEVGLQDGYSFGRGAFSAGAGAVFGGGLGGVIGGAVGGLGARGMRGLADEARAALPEPVFNNLSYSDALRERQNFPEMARMRSEEEAAAPEPTAEGEPAPTGFDPLLMQRARASAEAELDDLIASRADPSQIRQAERNVIIAIKLQRVNELNASYEKNTLKMFDSDDAATRSRGTTNSSEYVRLNALARAVERNPTSVAIRELDEQVRRIEAMEALADQANRGPDGAEPDAPTGPTEPGPTPDAPSGGGAAPQLPPPTRSPEPAPAPAPEPEAADPTPEVQATQDALASADPEAAPEAPEFDDDALDIFDAVMADLEPFRGDPKFREAFDFMVNANFPEARERTMAVFDARFDNPNGLAADAWAKLQAQNKASETPARSRKRANAKNGKIGSTTEMADNRTGKSIIDQLIEQGAAGKLARDPATARAIENEASASQQRAIDNAKQTATEIVNNPARSGTGRAADTLAEGPVTAGLNDRGRPQDILKPGQATERDPVSGEATRTVTDGPAPQRSNLSIDEFKLEAQRNAKAREVTELDPVTGEFRKTGQLSEAEPVASWVAKSDMTGVVGGTTRRWKTKKGRDKIDTGYVPKGTTVFYAPQTDRFYVDQRTALTAIGRAPERNLPFKAPTDGFEAAALRATGNPDAIAAAEAAEAAARAPAEPPARIEVDRADTATALEDLLAGRITPDEFKALVQSFRSRDAATTADPTAKRAATADAATETTPPPGSVLALRNRADPNKVRVLTPAQAKLGQGVSTLLGKADPDQWEVGYVPAGSRSGQKSAIDGFTPDADFDARVEAITEAEVRQGEADADRTPMSAEEAETEAVDLSSLSSDEMASINDGIDIINSLSVGQTGRIGRLARDSDITVLTLNAIISILNGVRWPKQRAVVERIINSLGTMNEVMSRVAPNGIARTTIEKEVAIERLNTMFSELDPKQAVAAREFIEALSSKRAPEIRLSGGSSYSSVNVASEDNIVRLKANKDRSQSPHAMTLYHEVAHWAYENILTPAERQEFWQTIATNYYRDGTADMDAIRARSAPTNVARNALDSPQEFFANQFMAWATTRRFAETWEDAPFWERFVEKIRTMVRGFLNRDFVDPDLEHLFERITPSERAAEEAASPIRTFTMLAPPRALKKKSSEYGVAHINQAAMAHNDIETALTMGNPEAAINAVRDFADFLFKLTSRDNTFKPVATGTAGNYAKLVRAAAYKMAEALNLKVDKEKLSALAPTADRTPNPEDYENPFDFEFDLETAGDAADIWLREGEGVSVTADPEAIMANIRAIFDDGSDVSISRAAQAVTGALNIRLKRNEGWAFPERVLPLAYAWRNERRARPASEGATKAKKKMARAAEKTKKEALKKATTKTKTKTALPDGKPAAPSTQPKDLTTSDLISMYAKGDEATQSNIARELLRRQKTEPDSDWSKASVTVPRDVMAMRLDEMDGALRAAMTEGDAERISQILYESWRRGEKRRLKALGSVKSMIDAEAEHSRGISEDGIMPNAPIFVREVQSFMSHREPEVQDTMRTLTYRALALMGKTMQRALGETNVLTTAEVYRLANKTQPVDAAAVFSDFRGEAFNGLRADLRRMAIGLTKNVSDPFDVLHEVHHLALRTNLFSSEDRTFISNSFTEAARGGDAVAAKRLDLYAKGKTVDDLSPAQIEVVAEEWFAETGALYSMGKVAKGDLFAIRESGNMRALSGKSKLIEMGNRLVEAVSYMVNGLMGRRTMKQMFRRLDGYGDMFDSKRAALPRSENGVPAEYAADYFTDLMASQPGARLEKMKRFVRNGIGSDERGNPITFYHGTPNGVALSSKDVVMGKGGGNEGEGIYLTLNPKAAQDVYAERGTRKALQGMILRGVDEGNVDINDVDDAMIAVDYLSDTRREINFLRSLIFSEQNELANLRRDPSRTPRQNLHAEHNVSRYKRRLEDAIDYEQHMRSFLEDLGVRSEPKVLGLVVRADNPADFRNSKEYSWRDAFVTNLVTDLEEQGVVEFEAMREWFAAMARRGEGRDEGSDFVGGVELLENLENLSDLPRDEFMTAVNRVLGARGYDAVQHQFKNTLSDGTPVSHEGVVLIDHVDPRTGKTVSASSKLKSIEASEFDETSEILYASLVDRTERPTIGIISQMAEGRSDTATMAAEVIARLEGSGAPKDFTQTITSMVRGRAPALGKTASVFREAFHATLSATSRRLELAGMNSIADWHRMHHVDQANLMGDRVYAIRDALKDLPDGESNLGRWLQNSWKPRKQPESHAKIFKALRMGLESPAAKRLTETEMAAARKIRGLLDAEFRELRKSGVIVGRVENYMPQIWDTEALQRDPEAFVNDLTDYFMAEAASDGRPDTRAKAEERAQGVWNRLISDDGHYLPPPLGSSRSVDSDHIRYQRLIRLEDPEFSLNAERLGKFLVNDLEGTLVKYFDGSTRSILQNGRFGTLNHGYFDYLRVMDEGASGIAALLSTNRVARREIRSINAQDGYMDFLELRDETPMPFQGREFEAEETAEAIIETFQTQGRDATRNLLMSFDVSKPPLGSGEFVPQTKSTYEHRVDAILDALQDGGGKRQAAKVEDLMLAQQAMQIALRKKVGAGPGSGDLSVAASRGIRTFNSVSLLSFTVLTSLPDIALPLIRSGQISSSARAWTKYMSDPEYKAAVQRTGVAIESIVHGHMSGMFATDMSGKLGRLNNRFFNATGLTPWTNMQREVAAATGFEAFRADINRAVGMRVGDGSDMSIQTPEFKRTMRRLRHFGLDTFVRDNRTLTEADLEDPSIKRAVVQFANESIFAPSPDEIPLWAQTPWGAVIFQLKSYPTMMMRMTGKLLGETGGDIRRAVKNGDLSEIDPNNLKRLGYLLAVGPAFAAASLGIKDIVMMRGGEDNRESELRARSGAKALPGFTAEALGYDEKLHGDKGDFLGWYIESLMAMGGFGLLADLLHSTVENADNGAYGQSRQVSALLGPGVGDIGSASIIAGGVLDSDETSNSKERAAWREAIRRIPVLGGIGGVREGAVDTLAGEAE